MAAIVYGDARVVLVTGAAGGRILGAQQVVDAVEAFVEVAIDHARASTDAAHRHRGPTTLGPDLGGGAHQFLASLGASFLGSPSTPRLCACHPTILTNG